MEFGQFRHYRGFLFGKLNRSSVTSQAYLTRRHFKGSYLFAEINKKQLERGSYDGVAKTRLRARVRSGWRVRVGVKG